ncbi:hypothetical protein FGADI_12475 [Fusarium gaditjirri]|uniref:Uncharacterized protein n=1 Tax=Fusarium gaditjirri TaxID=282569 RepID=A0A8H4WP47_9HYPO|nr:hypothetical protein FGADI_12475 [Fusarium gaditjirri]
MPSRAVHKSKFAVVVSDEDDELDAQAPRNVCLPTSSPLSPEGRADVVSLEQEPNTSEPTASDAAGSSTAAQSPPAVQSSAQAPTGGDAVPAPVNKEGLWCETCLFEGVLREGDMPSCETSKGCANCDKAKKKCREMTDAMVPFASQLRVACSNVKDAATPELRAEAQEKQRQLKQKIFDILLKSTKAIMDHVDMCEYLGITPGI